MSQYSKRKTTEQFIAEAVAVHGDRYIYSEVEYINSRTKVVISCREHGDFEATPNNHLNGNGCPKCKYIKSANSKKKFHLNKRNWNFEQPEDYKLIPLTQGKFAKVDNEDFDSLKGINWCYSGGYAINDTVGLMHRYVMNAPDHLHVDHKEIGSTLDNRKSNLRLATHIQNQYNKPPRKGGSSNYKGVCWNNFNRKWMTQISFMTKRYYLGYFKSEEEAAKAYDKKALELHKEFAYLNFPELKEEYLKEINKKFVGK